VAVVLPPQFAAVPGFGNKTNMDAEEKVQAALDECRDLLTSDEIETVDDYNRGHGEWGLAIETLADILGEKECSLSCAQYEKIATAFAAMGLNDSKRLGWLQEHLKETG
jgi:hypothetical protein